MKLFWSFICLMAFTLGQAQSTANRFFYELKYKPSTQSDSIRQAMTILDILPEKSIYRDELMISQDSLLKAEVEKMMKTGAFKDLSKSIKKPNFSYKVIKTYPSMEIRYTDHILQDKVSYDEKLLFDWKIFPEKKKIGEYNAQKATSSFAGRNYTAWFSNELPFQDGPYKFFGLPGLIVQLEDETGDYQWTLKGNKKVDNHEEESYSEKLMKQFGQSRNEIKVSKEKFEQMYEAYKKDPFGSIRHQISQIPAEAKMPDGTSISKMMKEQEEQMKKHLNENDNTIEIRKTDKNKK
ncbi:GLPGLI family protein [Bergeyella sp. RCAD1439]|uniref:GLPGLI family protein n=1 Tax=Bergeyella anatis TaxID=3113737 RepID=UPI002E1939A2|nr:GLPGLI family protein [Bergeyella sp. RCAD1439]